MKSYNTSHTHWNSMVDGNHRPSKHRHQPKDWTKYQGQRECAIYRRGRLRTGAGEERQQARYDECRPWMIDFHLEFFILVAKVDDCCIIWIWNRSFRAGCCASLLFLSLVWGKGVHCPLIFQFNILFILQFIFCLKEYFENWGTTKQ